MDMNAIAAHGSSAYRYFVPMEWETNVVSRKLNKLMERSPSLNTLEKVAKASGLGYGTVRRAKNGEGNSTLKTLQALADAFRVRLDEITRDDDVLPPSTEPTPVQRIDSDYLYDCVVAVGDWIAGGKRKLDAKQKIELACHLYDWFFESRPDTAKMVQFLDMWLAASKQKMPGSDPSER